MKCVSMQLSNKLQQVTTYKIDEWTFGAEDEIFLTWMSASSFSSTFSWVPGVIYQRHPQLSKLHRSRQL